LFQVFDYNLYSKSPMDPAAYTLVGIHIANIAPVTGGILSHLTSIFGGVSGGYNLCTSVSGYGIPARVSKELLDTSVSLSLFDNPRVKMRGDYPLMDMILLTYGMRVLWGGSYVRSTTNPEVILKRVSSDESSPLYGLASTHVLMCIDMFNEKLHEAGYDFVYDPLIFSSVLETYLAHASPVDCFSELCIKHKLDPTLLQRHLDTYSAIVGFIEFTQRNTRDGVEGLILPTMLVSTDSLSLLYDPEFIACLAGLASTFIDYHLWLVGVVVVILLCLMLHRFAVVRGFVMYTICVYVAYYAYIEHFGRFGFPYPTYVDATYSRYKFISTGALFCTLCLLHYLGGKYFLCRHGPDALASSVPVNVPLSSEYVSPVTDVTGEDTAVQPVVDNFCTICYSTRPLRMLPCRHTCCDSCICTLYRDRISALCPFCGGFYFGTEQASTDTVPVIVFDNYHHNTRVYVDPSLPLGALGWPSWFWSTVGDLPAYQGVRFFWSPTRRPITMADHLLPSQVDTIPWRYLYASRLISMCGIQSVFLVISGISCALSYKYYTFKDSPGYWTYQWNTDYTWLWPACALLVYWVVAFVLWVCTFVLQRYYVVESTGTPLNDAVLAPSNILHILAKFSRILLTYRKSVPGLQSWISKYERAGRFDANDIYLGFSTFYDIMRENLPAVKNAAEAHPTAFAEFSSIFQQPGFGVRAYDEDVKKVFPDANVYGAVESSRFALIDYISASLGEVEGYVPEVDAIDTLDHIKVSLYHSDQLKAIDEEIASLNVEMEATSERTVKHALGMRLQQAYKKRRQIVNDIGKQMMLASKQVREIADQDAMRQSIIDDEVARKRIWADMFGRFVNILRNVYSLRALDGVAVKYLLSLKNDSTSVLANVFAGDATFANTYFWRAVADKSDFLISGMVPQYVIRRCVSNIDNTEDFYLLGCYRIDISDSVFKANQDGEVYLDNVRGVREVVDSFVTYLGPIDKVSPARVLNRDGQVITSYRYLYGGKVYVLHDLETGLPISEYDEKSGSSSDTLYKLVHVDSGYTVESRYVSDCSDMGLVPCGQHSCSCADWLSHLCLCIYGCPDCTGCYEVAHTVEENLVTSRSSATSVTPNTYSIGGKLVVSTEEFSNSYPRQIGSTVYHVAVHLTTASNKHLYQYFIQPMLKTKRSVGTPESSRPVFRQSHTTRRVVM